MKLCDITIAYNEKSGGIKTYIDAKREFLLRDTDHEHLLIIPGDADHEEKSGRQTIVQVASPLLPNQEHYRIFLPGPAIKEALLRHQPDIIELGSYYMEAWAAFAYRRRMAAHGRACLVSGYFHTDAPQAYVAAPLKSVAETTREDISETLGALTDKIADAATASAALYFGNVFRKCDLVFAAEEAQAARLREYGVEETIVAPLGVDADLFHPQRRSTALRARLGAPGNETVLVYAGRISTEKRIATVLAAFERLAETPGIMLWIIGDGPLREEVSALSNASAKIRFLPYETDRDAFAELLASADIYVTAGPYETFGLSVLEAQSSGLPVVGVAAGALIERVQPGLGLLGPVDDADAMARNVLEVRKNLAPMSEAARAHVEQHFSWRKTLNTLIGIYEQNWRRLARERAEAPFSPRQPERIF